jgi:vancomycin resistance protein YoaR
MLFIVVAFIALVCAGLWGWVYTYVSQKTIPYGIRIANWDIGGMNIAQVEQEWKQRVEQLQGEKITLHIPAPHAISESTTFEQLGVSFRDSGLFEDIKKLSAGSLWERAKTRYNMPKQWDLNVTWDPKPLEQKFNASWEKQYLGVSVNAVRLISPKDEVSYIPDQSAYRIDWERTKQSFQKLIPHEFPNEPRAAQNMNVTLIENKARITLESLQGEGIDRKIIEFTTSFTTSATGRAYNVTAAANTLNNTLLKPGDIFDYAKIIAETEKKYGFREAPVIFQGKLIPGIGGGICQVSSTLYNAVLRTGVKIVERRNHSLPVSYLPIGQDATFSEGNINFRFQNTTGKSLLIRTEVAERKLTVKLFGTMEKNIRYDIESNTVKVLEPAVKYVINNSLPAGSQEVLSNGKQGFIVETYQIKSKDGQVIEKKRISRDTYQPQPMLVAVNNTDELAPQNNNKKDHSEELILEDGVVQ